MIRKASPRLRLQLSILAATAGLLVGCGGGPPPMAEAGQAGATRQAPTVYDPGSATLPGRSSRDSFGDFNSALWNDHEWYECDCSRHPQPVRGNAPWG